jgi:hypothetical protein
MTDKDVQREIEANERRAREHVENDEGIVGALEDALDPFTNVEDAPDEDDVASQRELNDAEQRRDA